MGRAMAGLALLAVAVVLVGWVAMSVLNALLGLAWYLIFGALVVGGGVYLYRRARRSMAAGTRNRRRLDAAMRTYEIRNR